MMMTAKRLMMKRVAMKRIMMKRTMVKRIMMKRLLLMMLLVAAVGPERVWAQRPGTAPTPPPASGNNAPATAPPAGPARAEDCGCEAQPLPDVLAVVNGVRITSREISEPIKARVDALQRQVTEARRRELDLQINSRLLEAEAKKRGVTIPKLLTDEVISKVTDPTEAAAQAFYDQNKARIQREFKDVKNDIISYLRSEQEREEARKFADRLRAGAQVKVLSKEVTPPANPADHARVFATINNQPITSEDIENSLRPLIYSVQEQVYNLRRQELELRINDALLEQEAQKRKITTNALLEAEVATKIKPVTEAEARAFYDQNKERLSGEFAQLKDRLIRYLQEREVRRVQTEFAAQLRRAATVQTFLPEPVPPTYSIATDDQPALGNTTAPVTIIEFTDYQCPSCAAAQPVIERLFKEYAGKVRLVARDFPLEQHANAFKAAEAAEAAREQGKYWEYIALLMSNQSKLDVASLKEYAGRLGLDRRKFDAALDSGQFSDKVQRDIADGMKIGVGGTPTIFVNGRRVAENNYESIKSAIDKALQEAGRK